MPESQKHIANSAIVNITKIKLKLSSKIDIYYSYLTTLKPVNLLSLWSSDLQKLIHIVHKSKKNEILRVT